MKRVLFTSVVVLLSAASHVRADVKLPAVFSDHMVLQQDRAIPVWGWADPGEKVTVTIGKQSKTAVADKQGKWSVKLDPVKSGKPLTMTVAGKNTHKISDVLVGEVWVGSGQSNMAMTVSRSRDFDKEKADAKYPQIRMFTVARKTAVEPQSDCEGRWVVCSPETVGGFSAAAYFFGRKLHKDLKVPVGILHTSWGGTPVEAWTSLKAQKAVGDISYVLTKWEKLLETYDADKTQKQYEQRLAQWKERAKQAKLAGKKAPRRPRKPIAPKTSQHRPANLFNGMVAPLIPYAIRGAIWYQGEHNAGREYSHLYGTQLATLIKDWRSRWEQGDFPFLWVQLPNFRTKQTKPVEPSGWVTVQEQMLKTLAVPNTGMAITIDVGEANDIHPKDKQSVGKRLALWALGTTYKKAIVYSGPIAMAGEQPVSGPVRIVFKHAGKGLKTSDGGDVKGFAIAGKDRKFVFAKAKIEGDAVIVWSDKVKQPVAVRYAWAANPVCNLVNSAGLPASPFRTDNWSSNGKK